MKEKTITIGNLNKPRYKTCKRCRALQQNGRCELGFETKTIWSDGLGSLIIGAKPLTLCSKPTTVYAFTQELSLKHKHKKR